jgi:UDP-N-acetyl-2-amino-2-deoxyglucuronate dehydrogenase
MFDFGCHRIELLRNILGAIKKVRAIATNVLFDREVEDTAAALFQFERGACGILSVTHAGHEAQDTLDVFCSRGSLHIPVLNEGLMRVVTDKAERSETHSPDANLHAPLIRDYVAAVMNGRAPAVTGDIGRAVAEIEEQIYASE